MNISLNNVILNKTYYVKEINTSDNLKEKLQDLGLTINTEIKMLYKSPFNDPCSYLVKNSVIALRNNDCKNIIVGDLSE